MATETWIEKARALGPQLAEHTARHDEEGTFVVEGYTALREGLCCTAAFRNPSSCTAGRVWCLAMGSHPAQ